MLLTRLEELRLITCKFCSDSSSSWYAFLKLLLPLPSPTLPLLRRWLLNVKFFALAFCAEYGIERKARFEESFAAVLPLGKAKLTWR